MIEFTKEIKEILEDDHIENIKENSFTLADRQSDQEVSITKLPKRGLKIKLPSGVHSAIIKKSSKKRYKKSCDYLVVIPDENHIIDVYFIELKKTFSDKDPYIQIFYTIPLWDYIFSMVRINNIEKKEIIKEIEEFKIRLHFVIITGRIHERRDKRKIRFDSKLKGQCNYKGKKFRFINSLQEIPFEYLKC